MDFKYTKLINDLQEGGLSGLPPEEVRSRSGDAASEIGKYTLINKLATGGSGAVWKAFDKTLNRYVAIKFINIASSTSPEAFRREAEVAAMLEHPNIVPIHEVGTHENQPFIVMKYIDGEPLDKLPDNYSAREKAELFIKVCDAIGYAHSHGVIHRDIKPQNILVDKNNGVYVVDFGIARYINSMLTKGDIVGTPTYMAPEQIDKGLIDERTDTYALCATLYHILTGKEPFPDGTTMEIITRVMESDPAVPSKIRAEIPRELDLIIMKGMSKDPALRYQSSGELKDDLERYLNNEPVKATRPSVTYLLRTKWSKFRWHIILASIPIIASIIIFLSLPENYGSNAKAETMAYKGMELWREGNIREGTTLINKAIRLDKKAINVIERHGFLEEQLERAEVAAGHEIYEDAIEIYNAIEKVAPLKYNTPLKIAEMYVKQKHFKEALPFAKEAVRREPDAADAHYLLGSSYSVAGQLEESARHYEKSIELMPDFALAKFNLAGVYYNLKQYENARDLYSELLRSDPGNKTLKANKKLMDDIILLESKLRGDPGNGRLLFDLAMRHLDIENRKECERILEKLEDMGSEYAGKLRQEIREKFRDD